MSPRRIAIALGLVLSFPAASVLAGTTTPETLSKRARALVSDEQLAQSCSSGMSYCAPGSYGSGGCYKPGYATCTAGLVCTGGMIACKPSNGGAAYCYKQGYGTCN